MGNNGIIQFLVGRSSEEDPAVEVVDIPAPRPAAAPRRPAARAPRRGRPAARLPRARHQQVRDVEADETELRKQKKRLIGSLPTRRIKPREIVADCAICMCPYTSKQLAKRMPCLHEFHSSCINKWLNEEMFCPICRHRLDSELSDEV